METVAWSTSDDGHLACVFSNGALAVIHDPPPTTAVVIAAAAHFIPGGEPYLIRRSDRIPVVYVYPAGCEIDVLTEDELAELDMILPRKGRL